jgi:hypothetical protein
MKRSLRGLIAAPVVVIGLLWAGPALAADPRIPFPPPEEPIELPAGDYCEGFTAVITFQDVNQYIISETTNPVTGATILHITGRARATVTNEATGESVSYNISGPGTLVLNTDGSFSADLAGPNLLWTALKNLKVPGDQLHHRPRDLCGRLLRSDNLVQPRGAPDRRMQCPRVLMHVEH